jgi:hypothetical protein
MPCLNGPVPLVEVKGSHAVYVSQPDAVAALIQEAAAGITAASRLVRGFDQADFRI